MDNDGITISSGKLQLQDVISKLGTDYQKVPPSCKQSWQSSILMLNMG
jgi:hypothetical protein